MSVDTSRPRNESLSRLQRTRTWRQVYLWAGVVCAIMFALFPIYWMLLTSITPRSDVFQFPPRFLPGAITLEHYAAFFETPALLKYLLNSIIVSGVTSIGAVIVSAYAAYSLSKFDYRGRSAVMYFIWSSQMFPAALLLIALYLLYDRVGLLDTHLALILSFMTFTLPLCTFILKGYFDTIPTEVIEAARLDGAKERTITTRVLLPIALPGMVAAGLFAFIRGWNDFIFALTLVGPERRTLPPGLVIEFLGEFQADWPELMAASLVTSMPVVIAFMALQKYFIEGLTTGSVKG